MENCEYLKLTNDEFKFWAGGDWQYPYTVTIKLVNGKLKVTDCHPRSKGDGNELKDKDMVKILDIEELENKKKERDAEKDADRLIERTKGMDFWNSDDEKTILDGIKNSDQYIPRNWTMISKYIKNKIKNKNKMELTKEDIVYVLDKIISESKDLYPEGWKELDGTFMGPDATKIMREFLDYAENENDVDENTYTFSSKDPLMQQKVSKLQSDSTLFDKNKDKINIANECIFTKNELVNYINEAKKNRRIGKEDYLKAIKKADREMEYEINGPGWKAKDRAHKDKSKYDRKRDSNIDMSESIQLNKKDIEKMILEKKYNGKIYTKEEFFNLLS